MAALAMTAPAPPFSVAPDGVRVAVRLTPRARRNRVEGLAAEAGGGAALKVSVTAVPEDGKANAALIALLAKEWRVPRSSIAITRGMTDRHKVLHVAGAPAELLGRLEAWWHRHQGTGS